jgi:hypothetical protein
MAETKGHYCVSHITYVPNIQQVTPKQVKRLLTSSSFDVVESIMSLGTSVSTGLSDGTSLRTTNLQRSSLHSSYLFHVSGPVELSMSNIVHRISNYESEQRYNHESFAVMLLRDAGYAPSRGLR